MQPSSPKPSMHEVVVGYFEPNAADEKVNITRSFGATINIINGGIECGDGTICEQAAERAKNYSFLLNYFGLEPQTGLSCENMSSFPNDSWGAEVSTFFDKDWDNEN